MPDHKPMILLASADARGELPELHQEVSRLDVSSEGLKDRGVDYRHLPYAELERIYQRAQRVPPPDRDLSLRRACRRGPLMLEAALGSADGAAHAEGLAGLLGDQRGLKLVFLNGCSTLPQVDLLLGAGVPAVIATSHAINDPVARDFAIAFYQALTIGREADGLARADDRGGLRLGGELRQDEVRGLADRPLREHKVKSKDVHEVTAGLPWLLRPSSGARALRWGLFEDDPLFGLPPLPTTSRTAVPGPAARMVPARPRAHLLRPRAGDPRTLRRGDRQSTPPVVLYYGAAGVGKSSVLHAGLVPRLEADHRVCTPAAIQPRPAGHLARRPWCRPRG